MVGVVLTGHGEFASGLASAVNMIAGDYPCFRVVTFEESDAATYPDRLLDTMRELRSQTDGLLVLCDLLGGTPFNLSMMATQEVSDVEVVAGANLPMLVEVLNANAAKEPPALAELLECALSAGRAGVVHKTLHLNDGDEEFF